LAANAAETSISSSFKFILAASSFYMDKFDLPDFIFYDPAGELGMSAIDL